MTTTTTTTTIDRRSLIQRRGEAELPANGHWELHRVSYVGYSHLHDQLQLPVSHGLLSITDPPQAPNLTIVAAHHDHWFRLTASTTAILPDPHGLSTWQLTGTLDDGTTRHAVDVAMTYHGVRRRSDEAWAWFTGRVRKSATPPRLLRKRGELAVVLDLLFNAPLSVERHNGHHTSPLATIERRANHGPNPDPAPEPPTHPSRPAPSPALKPAC